MNCLLSICIPTYNRVGWLRNTLPLWIEQANECGIEVEIVVSDNASDDDTPQVVAQAQKIGPFRYHRNEQNIGGNPNFYKLVSELAHGEYVWVVGDDDWPTPGALERILTAMRSHPDLDFFYVPYQPCLAEGEPEQLGDFFQISQHSGPGHDFGAPRRTGQLKELVAYDSNCFTPIYCSIFRRPLAVAAFEGSLHETSFTTPRSVSSHAIYIAENLLDKPAYFLGETCLVVFTGTSWPSYYPIYWLDILPQIYDCFERNGADKTVINGFRRGLLRAAGYPLFCMIFRSQTPLRKQFSFWKFLQRYKGFKEFWLALLSVIIRATFKNLPPKVQNFARRFVKKT